MVFELFWIVIKQSGLNPIIREAQETKNFNKKILGSEKAL